MAVYVKELKPYGAYDFTYDFIFDRNLNLEKAHDNLVKYRQTRYTRWVSLTIPPKPRATSPETWGLWISPHTAPYPYVFIMKKRVIEFRGYYPVPMNVPEKFYLYNLLKDILLPFLSEKIIYKREYDKILEYFKPVVPKEIVVEIMGFKFHLKEDWKYKIFVNSPTLWIKDWQTDMFGKAYSVKHRTIMLLQTLGIARNYFAGYKWVHLSEEAIKKRLEHGIQLKVWRTLQYDPNNRITVTELSSNFWEVDFSNLSRELPRDLDLTAIEGKIMEKGYKYSK